MSDQKVRAAYTLDRKVVEDIGRYAERHGVSCSTLVEAAMKRWLLGLSGADR